MKNKLIKIIFLVSIIPALFSCNDNATKKIQSDLYIQKVKGLKSNFALGIDCSSVIALENSGVKYYDYNGNEQDVFKTISESGVNYIRVRVWNNPYDKNGNGYGGGNCDLENCIAIGKRATQYGMKLLVNFHYSDFWTDPSKQFVPKAWTNYDLTQKGDAIYRYTCDSLNRLKEEKIDVGMVQIGNETNSSFCGEKLWTNITKLLNEGSKAVRDTLPKAKVVIHFANPEIVTNYENYSKQLHDYHVDYDIFATSYYPYYHGTLENLSNVLSKIANTYDKKVMVAENSYAYTNEDSDFYGNKINEESTSEKFYPITVQGQANQIRDLVDTIANKTDNGVGVFYWEGAWISVGKSSYEENKKLWEKYGSGWATSYASEYDPNDAGQYYGGCACENEALFDKNGKPLESLKTFNLIKYGNTNVKNKIDSIINPVLYSVLGNGVDLPTKVTAILNDNSKKEFDVEWNIPDGMFFNKLGKYTIKGVSEGNEVTCTINIIENNILKNGSFEDGKIDPWRVYKNKPCDELFVEKKPSDSLIGDYHFHFYSKVFDTVDFSLEQELPKIEGNNFKYKISIMGGNSGESEIYSYVKINNEIKFKQEMSITSYGIWDTKTIENIDIKSDDKVIVGIYVKCHGTGAGAWGKIDEAVFSQNN